MLFIALLKTYMIIFLEEETEQLKIEPLRHKLKILYFSGV